MTNITPLPSSPDGKRCWCGAEAKGWEMTNISVDVTSYADPFPVSMEVGAELEIECQEGHKFYGWRDAERKDESSTSPTPPSPLGPAIPEVVSRADYRRAFGEYEDEDEDEGYEDGYDDDE